MGRSLGKGMREFKNSITGKDEDAAPAELPAATEAEPKEPVSTSSDRDA
jgi:Sec-independent protein translocase protein TatA